MSASPFSTASLSVLGALLLAGPASAQADGPVQLGPVSVSDQSDKDGLNHSPPLASMPSTSLQDTPQAVNVIDQQTMKSQATSTLSDALRNVPGITIAIGEGGTLAGDQFKIARATEGISAMAREAAEKGLESNSSSGDKQQ